MKNEWTDRVRDDAVTIDALKKLYQERGDMLSMLLEAPLLDMATIAMLIGQSANPEALSKLQGQILAAVEDIKEMRKILEVKS